MKYVSDDGKCTGTYEEVTKYERLKSDNEAEVIKRRKDASVRLEATLRNFNKACNEAIEAGVNVIGCRGSLGNLKLVSDDDVSSINSLTNMSILDLLARRALR